MKSDFRVVKVQIPEDSWFEVHNVDYDDSGVVVSTIPTGFGANGIEELLADLAVAVAAFDKPVLDNTDLIKTELKSTIAALSKDISYYEARTQSLKDSLKEKEKQLNAYSD